LFIKLRKSSFFHAIATNRATTTNILLDKKIENATAGLRPSFAKALYNIPEDNVLTIVAYIQAMKSEINPSNNYRKNIIEILCTFSEHNDKPFNTVTREDILAFLDSFRKTESSDPLHKWIGTYNVYRMQLFRFFKWLYY
jgi:hypothetical protein